MSSQKAEQKNEIFTVRDGGSGASPSRKKKRCKASLPREEKEARGKVGDHPALVRESVKNLRRRGSDLARTFWRVDGGRGCEEGG